MDCHDLIDVSCRGRGLYCDADSPAIGGRSAGNSNVTAQTHQYPRAESVGDAGRGPIGHEGLGGRSEVENDAFRDPHRSCPRIEVNVPVPDDGAKDLRRERRLVPDLIEITVIAEGRHGIADGRVDGSVGPLRDINGHFKGFEEQWGDGDRRTGERVKAFELRVRAKATAGEVDGCDLVTQKRFCGIQAGRIDDSDGGRCADGSKGALHQLWV